MIPEVNPYASPQAPRLSANTTRFGAGRRVFWPATMLGLAVLLVLVGLSAFIMLPWPNPATMTFTEWQQMQQAQEQDTQNRELSAAEE